MLSEEIVHRIICGACVDVCLHVCNRQEGRLVKERFLDVFLPFVLRIPVFTEIPRILIDEGKV